MGNFTTESIQAAEAGVAPQGMQDRFNARQRAITADSLKGFGPVGSQNTILTPEQLNASQTDIEASILAGKQAELGAPSAMAAALQKDNEAFAQRQAEYQLFLQNQAQVQTKPKGLFERLFN